MNHRTLVFAAAAGLGLVAAPPAGASTINELILADPTLPVTAFASDENREAVIDADADGRLSVGDTVQGVLAIEQLFVSPAGSPPNASTTQLAAGNSELTGSFSFRVATKLTDPTRAGTFVYTFAADPAYDAVGRGTLFRFYEDVAGDAPDTTYVNHLDNIFQATAFLTDDRPYFELGLVRATNRIVASGSDSLAAIAASNPSDRLLTYSFALDRTGEKPMAAGYELMLADSLNFGSGGTGEVVGTAQVGGGLAGSQWRYSSNTDFEFLVIPEPATLALIAAGCLLLVRRQPKVASVAPRFEQEPRTT